MPRQKAVAVENNFIRGLITEATGLKFPENAATEIYNCVINHRGDVTRRLGLDFEEEYAATTMTLDNNAKSCYIWHDVAQEGGLHFVVVQNGLTLHFYEVSSDSALSANKHADTIDLSTYLPGGGSSTGAATHECQYASANGKLVVTHPKLNSIYVEYDAGGDSIDATQITVRVRDFEGDLTDTLYDPPDISTRPTSTLGALAAAHRYNLENQGWTSTTLTSWDTARSDMPSNADVPWYYKADTNPGSAFDFSKVANVAIGNSKAPNGHFIYNLYDTDRATNVSGAVEAEITLDRLSACSFFAGRVWYGGLRYQNYNSKVFFSQIIEHEDQIGRCYQANDPTSELDSDLLASDGGFIDLLEAGNVIKITPYLNSLLVFCSNGVWVISGSQGISFAANDYSVNKISSVPITSSTSFVDTEDTIFFWTQTGIYTIRRDPQTNSLSVANVSDNTIKEFYEDIPLSSRDFARGIYNPKDKKIEWVYGSTAASSFTEKYKFDSILNLNLLTGAFYPWITDITDVYITGIVSVIGAGGAQVINDVVSASGVNNVQAASGTNEVVVFQQESSAVDVATKYLVSYVSSGNKITFAEAIDDAYVDWYTYDTTGVEFESYFKTGYAVRGEGLRKFQQNYVNVFSNNALDNSFTIEGLWGYSNSSNSSRWSSAQTFSNVAGYFDVKPRRIKIRGHGLACQLKFTNNSTNPFHIIGWSTFVTGNTSI